MLVKSVVPKVIWTVFSSLPYVLSQEKIFVPFQRHIQIVEVEIDGAAIHRQEAEMGLCHCEMDLSSQE